MTLVNMDKLQELLIQTKYDPVETDCVVNGFKNGFDLGYRGRRSGVKCLAPNLKICVGSPTILWNKIMKEVKNKRYAGPFEKNPFDDHFIQLPVGLVPKDGGKDTRLIFHLSYPRNGSSINSETPKEFCTVNIPILVRLFACVWLSEQKFVTFRNLIFEVLFIISGYGNWMGHF